MAVLGLLLAPVSWLGRVYAANLVASLVVFGLLSIALWKRSTLGVILACGLGVAPIVQLIGGVLISPLLILQVIGVFAIVMGTFAFEERPRLRIGACAAWMLAVFSWGAYSMADRYHRLETMREAYPVVSLADRLPATDTEDTTAVTLTEDQEVSLASLEHARAPGWSSRQRYLSMLHRDWYEAFAIAGQFGAGVTRMPYLSLDSPESLAASPSERFALPITLLMPATPENYGRLHDKSVVSFLNTDRNGYAESIDFSVGFEPHAFVREPQSAEREQHTAWVEADNQGEWRLDQLDLIGAVLHDPPAVYVSEHLPTMEDLHDTPTRVLSEFESESMQSLYGESDLEIEEELVEGGLHVRMVGALRAAESCTACHDRPRGSLLGAFSYKLVRLSQTPTPQSPASDGG